MAYNQQLKATALNVAAFDKLLAFVVKVNCSLSIVKKLIYK
jgi:hypothetical protein